MITQSDTPRREDSVRNTEGLEPAYDDGLIVAHPESEIHIDIDDLEKLDRNRENDQASTNQTEKTMKQNNHTALTKVHPQQQLGSIADSAADAIREVEWGDPDLMTENKLERIRLDKNSGRPVRLAILPFLPPRGAKVHWIRNATGMVCRLCLGKGNVPGYCCTKLEEPEWRAVALAVRYDNAGPKGQFPKDFTGSVECTVGYVELSRSNFCSISQLVEEGASIYDFDIVMSKDARRYQFKVVSRKPRWKLDPEVAKAVEEAARPFVIDGGARLAKKIGKQTSLAEWKALLSGATAKAPEVSLDDVENL